MFAFTKWTIIKNSLPFFLFAHFLRGLIHFMLAVCYAFAFPRSPLHFPASSLPIASTLRCTLCTISLFSRIFFSEVCWNTTHSLSIHFYCARGTRKLAKKKTQKRLYFFRTYTPWCICVFFSMNLYNLLR